MRSIFLLCVFSASTAIGQTVEERLSEVEGRLDRIESMLKVSGTSSAPSRAAKAANKSVFEVKVTNKRFDEGAYEDSIWWDTTYTAVGLEKSARAVKGTLVFADLFGEPKFRVNVTVDEEISAGGVLQTNGVGIDYNQFKASHKWLRSTDLEDMTIWYEVDSILYADGTRVTLDD